MAILVNEWIQTGHTVNLILTTGKQHEIFYELDSRVTVTNLDIKFRRPNKLATLSSLFAGILLPLRQLRAAIEATQPDAILSFIDITNVMVLLAMRGTSIPIVVSERIDPKLHDIGRLWSRLRSISYRWATKIVMQTSQSVHHLPTHLRSNTAVIANPVQVPDNLPEKPDSDIKTLIAIGRLAPQKGYDLLLAAFAQIAPDHPHWELHIYGAGKLEAEIQIDIDQRQLSSQVKLQGLTKTPFEKLAQADLFVLASRYEGFPNVLLEAMACGLPAVSFDCPSGPADLIQHAENGMLVPAEDVDKLATTLADLMQHPAKAAVLGNNALSVRERYAVATISQQWLELLS